MNINENNIYEKGVLIAIHIGSYAGRKKLDKEQMKELPTEIVRGVHDLFDKDFKEMIKNIWSFDNEARGAVKNMSIQFPLDGVYFLKSEKIEAAINLLEEAKEKRKILINEAVEAYDDAIKTFAEKYPDFYQKARNHYISREDFASRFHFDYQLLKIAPPEENSVLTPEMYKREMAKFKQNIDEMKNEVLATITQTLLETTERLKSQCDDGKPNQRTFNNLNKFLKRIDDVYSDFIDRDDLKSAIANVRASILGVDANSLRSQEDFKKEFKTSISAAADCIKALPDVKLKRSIEF